MASSSLSLFVDHIPGETRVAILEDERLIHLFVNRSGQSDLNETCEGDLYYGRVVNVVPSLQAAFVDIATGQNGFLPVSATQESDISKAVHEGELILVQIRKAPRPDKGAGLSCKLELTSAHCILTPMRKGLSLSKKIDNPETRARLIDALDDFIDEDTGLVIRTDAQNIPLDALQAEIQQLQQRWKRLQAEKKDQPGLLEGAKSFLPCLADELKNHVFDRVCVEGIAAFQTLKSIFPQAEPYHTHPGLFQAQAIEDQIEEALNHVIPLDQGGDIRIERTAALIAIDVNMGTRLASRDAQDNIFKANLSALEKIHEQIVLRNLSGQIVIDFISMKSQSQRDKLLDRVQRIFKTDPRTVVHGFTRLGLCELSRQRIGTALDEQYQAPIGNALAAARRIAHLSGGNIKLHGGPDFIKIWESAAFQPTRLWLYQRLGYPLEPQCAPNLAPSGYEIEES